MARQGTQYWVDGYNVVLRLGLGAGASLEERRAELVHRAASLNRPCWIVFDSREGGNTSVLRPSGRVRVQFARGGQSADEVLLDRVQRARDLRHVVVVTDDRELAQRCAFLGAGTQSVAQFAARLLPTPPAKDPEAGPGRPLNRREVDDWLDYFGVDREPPPDAPGDVRGGGPAKPD